MSFNNKIKELRKKNNWTQEDLAKKMNLQNTHICRYETGNIKPGLDILKKFAKIFNVSIDYILGEENEKNRTIKIDNEELYQTLKDVEYLPDKDKETVRNVIEGLSIKNKIKNMSQTI